MLTVHPTSTVYHDQGGSTTATSNYFPNAQNVNNAPNYGRPGLWRAGPQDLVVNFVCLGNMNFGGTTTQHFHVAADTTMSLLSPQLPQSTAGGGPSSQASSPANGCSTRGSSIMNLNGLTHLTPTAPSDYFGGVSTVSSASFAPVQPSSMPMNAVQTPRGQGSSRRRT